MSSYFWASFKQQIFDFYTSTSAKEEDVFGQNPSDKKAQSLDEAASQMMSYETSNIATECCNDDEVAQGHVAARWSVKNEKPIWPVERGSLPDYDLDEALATEGSLIDTHFHLDFICRRLQWKPQSFKEFMDYYKSKKEVSASFAGGIAVFCKPDTWMIQGLEDQFLNESFIWTTFGVHPHFAHMFDFVAYETLKIMVQRKNVVAVGEIGLDYSRKNRVDHWLQKQVFAAQLRIAIDMNLPICLHVREATRDAFEVLDAANKFNGTDYPLHLHCYTSDWEECSEWLTRYPGLMVGLTPFICNSRFGRPIHEVVQKIPLDRILFETDSPYFLPPKLKMAKGGWFNESSHPGHVIHTAAQVAAIRKQPLDKVLKQVRVNVKKMYRI